MTTKFEFGFGEGDIFRRRMEAQDEMFRQVSEEQQDLPEEDRQRLDYGSDYYGFRGAGRRAGNIRTDGGSPGSARRRRDRGGRRRTR